jgi:hypothetical protein
MQLGTGQLTLTGNDELTIQKVRHDRLYGMAVNVTPDRKIAMSPDDAKYLSAEVLELREALKMLYDLLEAYAPAWYTEEHHNKAQAALHSVESDRSSK